MVRVTFKTTFFSLQECRYPGTKLTLPIFYSGKNGNGKKKDYENENPSWNNRCDVTELFDGFFLASVLSTQWGQFISGFAIEYVLKICDLTIRDLVKFSNPGGANCKLIWILKKRAQEMSHSGKVSRKFEFLRVFGTAEKIQAKV